MTGSAKDEASPIINISFLGALMLVATGLCLCGLRAGLPSQRQTALVFPDPAELQRTIPAMASRREKIYQYFATRGPLHIMQNYDPACQEAFTIDGPGGVSDQRLDTMRSFLLWSVFPDEPFALKVLSQIDWRRGDFNPRCYIYGGMYFYAVGAAMQISSWLGLIKVTRDTTYYFSHPEDLAGLFLIPKILGAIMFILSIPIFFTLGKECHDTRTAVIAVLLYCFTPIIVVYSHFFKPHVFVLPFVNLCMLAALRLMRTGEVKWYAWAGIFAGLSAGSFGFCGAILLCPLGGHAAWCLTAAPENSSRNLRARLFGRRLFILAAATVLAFFLTNPYWFLHFREACLEINIISSIRHYSLSWPGLKAYLFRTVPEGVGYTTALLFLGGLLRCGLRPARADAITLALVVPFIFYTAGKGYAWNENLHLSMVMVPSLILLSAQLLAELWASPRWRVLAAVLTVLGSASNFLNSVHYARILTACDQKFRAGEYINSRIPAGAAIGTEHMPYVCTAPPFHQLAYRLSSLACGGTAPDYYITMAPAKKTIEVFNHPYELERFFTREPVFLDRFYRDHFLWFLVEPVSIYRLRRG